MKALILTFFLTLHALANPAWMQQANIPKSGPLDPIKPTQLTYTITWNGRLDAGNFKVLFGEKDPRYPKHFLIRAFGGSTGWAHALYPYTFNYTSFMNPKTLRPIMFVATENDNKGTKDYQYNFNSKGASGTEKTTRKGNTKTETTSFAYPNTLDLFGGLLQIRSLPLKNNDKIVMPFHPIAAPYLATVTVLGREKHMGRDCIKVDIALRKIGDDLELKPYKKLKSATVWLSDDSWRIPLEVRAKVFIGDVRIFLTQHENL